MVTSGWPISLLVMCRHWNYLSDKIMTTAGEGGMVNTSRPELWDVMWSLSGSRQNPAKVFIGRGHPHGFRWLHERFGSNFRLTGFQLDRGASSYLLVAGLLFTRWLFCLLKHWVTSLAACSRARAPHPRLVQVSCFVQQALARWLEPCHLRR